MGKFILFRLDGKHLTYEIGPVLSVTTDNGCEFLDDKALKKVFGASVFYTDAYCDIQPKSTSQHEMPLHNP